MKLAGVALSLAALSACASAQRTEPEIGEIKSACDAILAASDAPEWREQLERLRDQCVAVTLATPGAPERPCDGASYRRGECTAR